MTKLSYIASVSSWDEDRSNITTPRVVPANVSFQIKPDPDSQSTSPDTTAAGNATTAYLMTYLPDGNASYIFTETVTLEDLGGKKGGSFITQGKGTFDFTAGVATGTFEVIAGTGTAGLQGITGTGSFGPAAPGSHDVQYEYQVQGVNL